MDLFKEIGRERPLLFRLSRRYWRFAYRIEMRLSRLLRSVKRRWPRFENEGEATAAVVNMALDGYPMDEDFATKEEAVRVLQSIWDIIDNWDGSRINVRWSHGIDLPTGGVPAWARGSQKSALSSSVYKPGDRAPGTISSTLGELDPLIGQRKQGVGGAA